MIKRINSIKDELIIEARELNKPSARNASCLLEGEDIVKWALDACVIIKHVFVSDTYNNSTMLDLLTKQNIPIYVCSEGIMKKINESKYLSPIIGVAVLSNKSQLKKTDLILLLDDLQDQGNIGTIIRTACAFGVDNIITTKRSVDIYNKKTITASRGAVFRINHENSSSTLEKLKELKNAGYQIVATSPHGNKLQPLLKLKSNPIVLIVGNETNGVGSEVLHCADVVVQIPMHNEIESLNVSVATGISLYELKLKVLIAMLTKNIRKTLGRNLFVAQKLMQHVFDLELKKICNYTSQQIILLMIIACDEIMPLKQIEKDMACYGAELDAILQPLLEENLIMQISSAEKSCRITPQGEELLAKIWSVNEIVEQKVLSDFTLAEQELFRKFIARIQRNCEEGLKLSV